MPDAKTVLDHQYLEMRWRILSLAADFDRIQRSEDGTETLMNDQRIAKLRKAIAVLLVDTPGRAEHIQILLSDLLPVGYVTNRKYHVVTRDPE